MWFFIDVNGNPIIVSAIVTYRIVDTVRAGLDVGNVQEYLQSQALAVLKRVCSKYPYEAREGHSLQHGKHGFQSLLTSRAGNTFLHRT